MPITIIGAGAIGGVIGAYLIRNGENVVFVDRDRSHVDAMNEKGLTIQLKEDSFTVEAKAYTVESFLASHRQLGTVFLAVKAQHTKEAIQPFEPLMKEQSFVVSFQNGFCEYEIADVVGIGRTVGCFVNLFADYIEPGKIEYGGVGSLYLGEMDGSISPRILDLKERLRCWGEAEVTGNIFGYLWSKLAYGAMLTATATTNREIAGFFEDPQLHGVLNALGTEVLEVAEKQGVVPEPFDDWDPALLFPVTDEAKLQQSYFRLAKRLRGYTKTRSGIWRDLAVRKRKTEVPQHLNPVIRIGEEHNLKLPLTRKLLYMVQEIENGRRDMGMDNIRELQALMQESEISKN